MTRKSIRCVYANIKRGISQSSVDKSVESVDNHSSYQKQTEKMTISQAVEKPKRGEYLQFCKYMGTTER